MLYYFNLKLFNRVWIKTRGLGLRSAIKVTIIDFGAVLFHSVIFY